MYINIYPSPDLLVIKIPEMSSLNNNSISLPFHSIKFRIFHAWVNIPNTYFFIILIDDPNLTFAPIKTNLANNLHFFFLNLFYHVHAKYPTIPSNYTFFLKKMTPHLTYYISRSFHLSWFSYNPFFIFLFVIQS